MRGKKSKSNAVSVTARTPTFVAPPPVSSDEFAAYEDLRARIFAHVRPSDPIEDLYARDFLDLTFELLKYRRYKSRILEGAIPRALEDKLAPFVNGRHRFGAIANYASDGAREPTPAMELVNEWMRHEPKAIKRVAEILESAKLTMEDIRAQALFLELGTIERIDRLIAAAEARRIGVMREIDRYRIQLADALKAAADEAEEAEFEVVASNGSG